MYWNRISSCALLLAGACIAPDLAFAQADTPSLDTFVREAAGKTMQQNDISGLSIAITQNGKQQFYDFGVASKETGKPVTQDTLFELGSISKTFTATLATWAQATGHLSLTANVDTCLPQLHGSRLGKVPVFHLGTHTAGGFPLQVPEKVQNTGQLMAWLKAWQPQYLPGTHRTYANPSVGLLGMIAARSLDVSFMDALQKRLFPALGLNNTYLDVPADKQPLYAQGYNKLNEPVRVNPGVLADEAYGVKSSSQDLIRFVEANMGRGNYAAPLQRALLDTRTGYFKVGGMTQDLIWEQYPIPVQLQTLLDGNAGRLSLQTLKAQPLEPPQPAMPATWVNKTGSTNGFGAYVAFIPEQQLGIVILANRNYPNEERVKLAYALLGELMPRPR